MTSRVSYAPQDLQKMCKQAERSGIEEVGRFDGSRKEANRRTRGSGANIAMA